MRYTYPRLMTAAALCTALLAIAPAQADDMSGPQVDRQTMMKQVGATVRVLAGMARGEAPYDAQSAVIGLRLIQGVAAGFPYLFPEGSETGAETEAAPAIWTDRAGFETAVAKLEADAAAAVETGGNGLEAFQAAFGAVASNCRSCHETYRVTRN